MPIVLGGKTIVSDTQSPSLPTYVVPAHLWSQAIDIKKKSCTHASILTIAHAIDVNHEIQKLPPLPPSETKELEALRTENAELRAQIDTLLQTVHVLSKAPRS